MNSNRKLTSPATASRNPAQIRQFQLRFILSLARYSRIHDSICKPAENPIRLQSRRVARRLFNFLTLLSTLLCIAAVTLWVRSYLVSDCIEHRRVHLEHGWNVGQFSASLGAVR